MKLRVSSHGASKDKSVFPPDHYDGSIPDLKCFACDIQVVGDNLHIDTLDLLAEKYEVPQCIKPAGPPFLK